MAAPCPLYGFVAEIALRADAQRDAFATALEAVAAGRGLETRITGSARIRATFTSESSQATEADRVALEEWLAAQPQVTFRDVGAVVDLRD